MISDLRFLSELRVTLRALDRRPAMVTAILLTLALGIGVNTAVFTIIEAVLLRPLAVANPRQLVAVYTTNDQTPFGGNPFALYRALGTRTSVLRGVAAFWTTHLPLVEGGDSRDVRVTLTSPEYFELLGVHPALGRVPAGDSKHDDAAVAVVSDAFWRARLGATRDILGHRLVLHGQPFIVVGVAPPTFRGTDLTAVPDLWIPLRALPLLHQDLLFQDGELNQAMPIFSIFARFAPNVGPERGASEINAVARSVALDVASSAFAGATSHAQRAASVLPLTDAAAGVRDRGTLRRFLATLIAVGLMTLLLACMNVANLLVIRGREQARELGIRMALGAQSRQVASYVIRESLVLGLVGGAAGVAVAAFVTRLLAGFTLPGNIAIEPLNLAVRTPMLAFAAALSILTALVFGVQPALRAMRLDVLEVLNDRTTEGRRRRRMGLLPVQVALSLVALMDAGLLLRSVRAGVDTNIGFDHRGVVAATIAYQPFGKYAESVQQYQAIIDELTQTQGVTSAAAATHVPLASYPVRPFAVGPYVEGAAASAAHTVVTGVSHVSNGYFDVLGVPLLEGRRFAAQDVAGATRVIILNASAAKALYPAESAIGKLVHAPWFGPLQFSYTVVGIVADTKYGALQDASIPFAFIPLAQEEAAGMSVTILARTRSPAAAFETIHRAIRQAAPDRKLASAGSATLPGAPIRLLTDQVVRLLAPQRFAALLLTCFGALSLCVSAVGIYGNVAYAVSRRTAEIGVRMALGARIVDVLWIVSRDVALAFAAGAAIGVVGCVVTSGLVARLLYDVAPTDPVAFLVALGLAAFTAIMAAVVPAWQAVRIDPARAIRGSG